MFAIVAILCMLFVPLAVFVVFIYAIVLGGEGLIVRHRKKKYQEDLAKVKEWRREIEKEPLPPGKFYHPSYPDWFLDKWYSDFK